LEELGFIVGDREYEGKTFNLGIGGEEVESGGAIIMS